MNTHAQHENAPSRRDELHALAVRLQATTNRLVRLLEEELDAMEARENQPPARDQVQPPETPDRGGQG